MTYKMTANTTPISLISKTLALRLFAGDEALKLGRFLTWQKYFIEKNFIFEGKSLFNLYLKDAEFSFSELVNLINKSEFSTEMLSEGIRLISHEQTNIRSQDISVNFFGTKHIKPAPEDLKGMINQLAENDTKAICDMDYLKVYRDLNLCHPFLDCNGRFSRAYLVSRLGFEKSLILLFRLRSNKYYGYSNYDKQDIFVYPPSFERYWEEASLWRDELLNEVNKMLPEAQKELARLTLSPSFAGGLSNLNDYYANPVYVDKATVQFERASVINDGFGNTYRCINPIINIYEFMLAQACN
ncbi:hypothetical protein CWE13_10420 [Aliidiomarina shirensis]|uniref:Fido domain-containing protein n=2 Tax=Aliidiomarina shirensis TaxID=1048642 RepID=A0A432WQ73_9GAMM|nr:hypothetical protein CWE13_10420 [Aliidiomarina shirensis]